MVLAPETLTAAKDQPRLLAQAPSRPVAPAGTLRHGQGSLRRLVICEDSGRPQGPTRPSAPGRSGRHQKEIWGAHLLMMLQPPSLDPENLIRNQ